MKVLSVKNPFSYMIVFGIKDVENRTWKTDYRGKLLIHSCGDIDYCVLPNELIDKKTLKEVKELNKLDKTPEEYRKICSPLCLKYLDLYLKCDKTFFENEKEYYMKKGYIIGEVKLVDIVKNSKSPFAEKRQYHWILENPKVYKNPIKIQGKLRLWDYKI
jgi:hypothetical protein